MTISCALPFLAAFAPQAPAQDPLPRVLLIGDSISIGYAPFVAELLDGQAEVHHNPGNAAHTGVGLEKLDEWLGDEPWDVIHFNWGLHDLCWRRRSDGAGKDKADGVLTHTPEQYAQNLDVLVRRLEATGADLVFATTTPVPELARGTATGILGSSPPPGVIASAGGTSSPGPV